VYPKFQNHCFWWQRVSAYYRGRIRIHTKWFMVYSQISVHWLSMHRLSFTLHFLLNLLKINTLQMYCIVLYLLHVPAHPYKAEAIGYRTCHTTFTFQNLIMRSCWKWKRYINMESATLWPHIYHYHTSVNIICDTGISEETCLLAKN
jgi:hypothetical protein